MIVPSLKLPVHPWKIAHWNTSRLSYNTIYITGRGFDLCLKNTFVFLAGSLLGGLKNCGWEAQFKECEEKLEKEGGPGSLKLLGKFSGWKMLRVCALKKGWWVSENVTLTTRGVVNVTSNLRDEVWTRIESPGCCIAHTPHMQRCFSISLWKSSGGRSIDFLHCEFFLFLMTNPLLNVPYTPSEVAGLLIRAP